MRALLLGCLLVVGCTEDESVAPVSTPAPPFRHQTFYETLRADADAFNETGGDWLEDLGDAPFYGLAFYAHTANSDDARWPRASESHDRARTLITDVNLSMVDLQEVTMSALGLVEYVDATGDRSDVPTIDEFADVIDGTAEAIGFYVPSDGIDSWALRTYGPTAISALIGLVNTELAVRVGGERTSERVAFAVEMAEHIAAVAYDGTTFAFGPNEPMLCLYPNVAMMLLDGRLYELTGDESYRERAKRTHEGIQPLRLSTSPTRYYSPYSAAAMGAQTTDYSTLSSHNYLMLALAVLWETTRDPRYVEELDSVLDALETELYGSWCLSNVHSEMCQPACATSNVCVVDSCTADRCGGGVLHHWIDGRPAATTDPEYFCSGCNLQTLYVMWYRQQRL